MIVIDGSQGEGGGQILRTALSLSMVTGQPFTIEKIRANRERGGLLRQHLTAVLAAAEISGANVTGAELGSRTLTFAPQRVTPGDYSFAVGTAGSATLVLQTLLPALMLANKPSNVVVEGGTHNMAAPPFDFLAKTFAPIIESMGPKLKLTLDRYGFYPAGGGKITAEIEPVEKLKQLELLDRGEVLQQNAVALLAHLPRHIADRELETASNILGLAPESTRILGTKNSAGPGNALMIEVQTERHTEIFTAFGKVGISAEKVAEEAAVAAAQYVASSAFACEHLADQLLLPIALAGGGSFTAVRQTMHARTNIEIIRLFLPVSFEISEEENCARVALSTRDRAGVSA
ncbi:RNA 3'-terminal phosphate cyclase [Candidatus Korobacter versatilis]|nr:RNA 3'-terminal phosphate cyclase [Candidatus Koribacter versatilis]